MVAVGTGCLFVQTRRKQAVNLVMKRNVGIDYDDHLGMLLCVCAMSCWFFVHQAHHRVVPVATVCGSLYRDVVFDFNRFAVRPLFH
jgi:hypothetical protein